MSERASFTTQYIYDIEDYKKIREALDQDDKYLCIGDPAEWSNGKETFEMPIVSGKIGGLACNSEWMEIKDALDGVETNTKINIVVMCDGGSIIHVVKDQDGRVDANWIGEFDDVD